MRHATANIRTIILACAILLPGLSIGTVGAQDSLGVVLLPPKGGNQGNLAQTLRDAMFLVEAPAMNWFSRPYEDTMPVIDGLVARLRDRGATRIVVGGHSLGANVALGYGARRAGLAGILAVAPGHNPSVMGWQAKMDFDYLRARKLVDLGMGAQVEPFIHNTQGRSFVVSSTAEAYLSWLDPDGPAVYRTNAGNLKPGTPLFWIVGRSDIMFRRGRDFAFNAAPAHPKSRYVEIDAGHRQTPVKGAAKIIEWLRSL